MPEFPLILSLSLLGSLKRKRIFMAFSLSLSLFVFSNAKTIVNLVQENKEEKEADAKEAARNCTTCSPCLQHFQDILHSYFTANFNDIYLPSPSLSLSLLGFHFSAFLLLLTFSRHSCELCGLIYQKSIRVHRLLLHVVLIC